MISLNFKRKLIGYTTSFSGEEIFLSPANDNETLLYLDNFQFINFVTFKEFKKIHSGFNCKSRKNRQYGQVNINEQLHIMLLHVKKTDLFKGKCNEDIFCFY